MKYFNYKVARDFGFAPNPFGGICTLATCKPRIRTAANIGDWVIGTASKLLKCENNIIYAMKVTDKISFNEYFNLPEYQFKKPVMNGSLVKMYGDNIYVQNKEGLWNQLDSHHSLADGVLNTHNLNKDTGSNCVLVSTHFYYFGQSHIQTKYKDSFIKKQGFKYLDEKVGSEVIKFISNNYEVGLIGNPINFSSFRRYAGVK